MEDQRLDLIFDIETDGFLPDMTVVHSLCIRDANSADRWSCHDHPGAQMTIKDGLKLLSKAKRLLGHNIAAFDIPAIKKIYPDWTHQAEIVDTLILARLFWGDIKDTDFQRASKGTFPKNMIGRYSLEAFGYRLGLQKGDYKKEMEAQGLDPWAEWNQSMQDYCELDVEVNYRVWRKCLAKWYDTSAPEGQQVPFSDDCVALEHKVSEIITRQIAHGFAFDVKAAQKLDAVLTDKRLEMEQNLRTLFPPWYRPGLVKTVKRTRRMKVGNVLYSKGSVYQNVHLTEFNPGSRDHIADRLIKLRGWKPQAFGKDGKPTVDDTVLSKLPYPEAKELSDYLEVIKMLGMLTQGNKAWLSMYRIDAEGIPRMHGDVNTLGAITRRMTHNNPNVAQVPSSKTTFGPQCRALFTVKKGKKLTGCDADALELRCLGGYMAAFDGGDYIRVVLEGDKSKGTDMHSVNCRALGMDPKKEYDVDGTMITGREIAKTWFYAFIYGAGNEKLGWTAGYRGDPKNPKHWTKKRDGSKQDAYAAAHGAKARAKFLKDIPALGTLVERIGQRVDRRGYLMSVDGSKLPVRSKHAALNTLLQSAGAIFMKRALVIADEKLQAAGLIPGVNYEWVANIHDELQAEVDEDKAEFVGQTIADAIREAGEYYNFKCPLAGNYDIGVNWNETH